MRSEGVRKYKSGRHAFLLVHARDEVAHVDQGGTCFSPRDIVELDLVERARDLQHFLTSSIEL